MNVLLVEDNDERMRLVRRIVELYREDLVVVPAASEEEAYRIISEHGDSVDIAIVDLQLNAMMNNAGLQVAEELRRVNPHSFIILASGYLHTHEFDQKLIDDRKLVDAFVSYRQSPLAYRPQLEHCLGSFLERSPACA